jgi:hypothetical protein
MQGMWRLLVGRRGCARQSCKSPGCAAETSILVIDDLQAYVLVEVQTPAGRFRLEQGRDDITLIAGGTLLAWSQTCAEQLRCHRVSSQ